MVPTFPADPVYANPCESDERRRSPEIVELAVEKNPLSNPRVVEVELLVPTVVNGKADEEMVTGEEPRTLKLVHDVPPEQVTEVVATDPSLAGEPFVVVQYESCPIVSLVEVEIEFARELRVAWSGMT